MPYHTGFAPPLATKQATKRAVYDKSIRSFSLLERITRLELASRDFSPAAFTLGKAARYLHTQKTADGVTIRCCFRCPPLRAGGATRIRIIKHQKR